MTKNTQQETDFTLRTDFQHDDNSTPPSGTLRSDAIRGIVITAIAAVVAFVLNNILPFEPLANKGLALAAFIGILWLTEAIHVTATAILVPLLALFIGIPEFDTKKSLVKLRRSDYFCFLWWLCAGCDHACPKAGS